MSGKPDTPKAKETPLEGLSNEQLLAMLTPLKNGKADLLSQKLKSAGSEIFAIGSELRLRAGLLRWEGEGADAFREWAGATGLATMKLGQYATKAGTCLTDVSQAITEASSGVEGLAKNSAAAKTSYANAQKTLYAANHDPDAGPTAKKDASADMTAAAATRESTRVEAMMKLRSLGQTYTHSGTQINNEPVPEFPPPAGFLGKDWVTPQNYKQLPSGTTSRTTRSTGTADSTSTRSRSTGQSDGSVVGSTDGGTTKPGVPTDRTTVIPDQNVNLGIDGTTVLPDKPTTPTGPTGTVPPKPDGPTTFPSLIPTVPPTHPNGGGSQRGIVPPSLGGGGSKTIPGGRGLTGPVLTGPGGTASARMPRDTGITGGRAVPPNGGRPAGGIPRSTVIGTEGGGTGRGPMGGGTMGHGGTGGVGGQGGTAAGRRLATETGGVVGGRAAQRPGQAAGRPFTPGGTGLVRGGQSGSGGPGAGQGRPVAGGARGAAARTDDGRDDERRGERPDYLTEDEETWQQSSRRVVPPVVD